MSSSGAPGAMSPASFAGSIGSTSSSSRGSSTGDAPSGAVPAASTAAATRFSTSVRAGDRARRVGGRCILGAGPDARRIRFGRIAPAGRSGHLFGFRIALPGGIVRGEGRLAGCRHGRRRSQRQGAFVLGHPGRLMPGGSVGVLGVPGFPRLFGSGRGFRSGQGGGRRHSVETGQVIILVGGFRSVCGGSPVIGRDGRVAAGIRLGGRVRGLDRFGRIVDGFGVIRCRHDVRRVLAGLVPGHGLRLRIRGCRLLVRDVLAGVGRHGFARIVRTGRGFGGGHGGCGNGGCGRQFQLGTGLGLAIGGIVTGGGRILGLFRFARETGGGTGRHGCSGRIGPGARSPAAGCAARVPPGARRGR